MIMAKFILGTKQNMTQVFDDKGEVHPATVLKTGPLTVTQVKTVERDGYNAVQVGFGTRNPKNITKPLKGHMNKAGEQSNFRHLCEFRTENTQGNPVYSVGDDIKLSTFSVGDKIIISAISKGKGFQGVVKRHGFKGGPRSHGQKHSEREPGSIGGGGRDGGRVARGKRMAGRMGADRVTVKGLTIVGLNVETGELFVRGAVPGRRGTLVEIRDMK